jgi:hypothetical protein
LPSVKIPPKGAAGLAIGLLLAIDLDGLHASPATDISAFAKELLTVDSAMSFEVLDDLSLSTISCSASVVLGHDAS